MQGTLTCARAAELLVENRVNFVNPGTAGIAAAGTSNTVLGSGSTFDMISSDVAPRIMQFAIKYAF